MSNKSVFNYLIKQGIKTWLKLISTKIDIQTLKLIVNNKSFGKVDELYLHAKNLIYQDLYINKIIIKIFNFNLKFKYKNHLIYSEDIIINSFLKIDKIDLKNIFFSSKWESLRIIIQNELIEGNNVSDLVIKNDLIIFSYVVNKLVNKIILSLYLQDNLIFLENIKSKTKIHLPVDKNIKFNICKIENDLIIIDLSSRVIFNN